MKLSEAQSKELLAQLKIPVPVAHLVTSLEQLAGLLASIPLPVFVKAQVPIKDRAAKGLVLLCHNIPEAIEAGRRLLGRVIERQRVDSLLVEEALETSELLYASVTIDPTRRSPVLLVSRDGGSGVEEKARPLLFPLPVLEPVAPWMVRRATWFLGYRGKEALSLADILLALVKAFYELEATLVEVNPLARTPRGWVALDARIELDDDALYRHPTAPMWNVSHRTALELEAERIDSRDGRGVAGRLVEFDGDLALLIGGGGASLTIFDAVLEAGLHPANYCEIGGNPSVAKVAAITKLLLLKPGVRYLAVIMNVVSNTRADLVARGTIKGIIEAGRDPKGTLLAFRVPGSWEDEARLLLAHYGIDAIGREIPLDRVVNMIADRMASHGASEA